MVIGTESVSSCDEIKADLTGLLVPIERCMSMVAGPVSASFADEASCYGYDDVPFLEEGQVVGFVPVSHLRKLADIDAHVFRNDTRIKRSFVFRVDSIDRVLEQLGSHRIAGVVGGDGSVDGIITISDLNRHGFRAIIYPAFAQLEEQLAKLIDAEFKDPWEWIAKVGDGRISIVGHWECLKKDGLDVGATAGATLSQLLKVVEETPALSSRSAWTKTKLSAFKNRALRFRNAVMHPTRPLVASQKDVVSLREFISDLSQLSHALRSNRGE